MVSETSSKYFSPDLHRIVDMTLERMYSAQMISAPRVKVASPHSAHFFPFPAPTLFVDVLLNRRY